MLNQLKAGRPVQERKCEHTALLDEIAGVVGVDDADGDTGGASCDLHAGIGDAAVDFAADFGGQHEDAVAQLI